MDKSTIRLPSHHTSSGWFVLARNLVLLYLLLGIVSVILVLPQRYQSLRDLKISETAGVAFEGWSVEQLSVAISELGIQPEVLAVTRLAASLICLLCFWGMGALLWRNRSGAWISLVAAAVLIGVGPGFSTLLLVDTPLPSWAKIPFEMAGLLVWPTLFISFYLFPNGRFVPRFTRYLFFLPYLLFILVALFPDNQPFLAIGLPVLVAIAFGGLASQVYRYRQVSTPEERQQTKWVVAAMAIFVVSLIAGSVIPALFPALAVGTIGRFWYEYLNNATLGLLVPALIPLAIGISILRYRLWDIDVIIRKTLVYTTLTALLAMVYFGTVTLLQSALTGLTGSQSPLVIVFSTLLIAALFSPLRRRIQSFIDRRFFRSKNDAAQTLAQFAVTVRDEVDVERLSSVLLNVVEQTMQPEKTSLWLKKG
jgi:hypothetical protein